jgi:hypothetical protein
MRALHLVNAQRMLEHRCRETPEPGTKHRAA